MRSSGSGKIAGVMLGCTLMLANGVTASANEAAAFAQCVAGLKARAMTQGISAATVNSVLDRVQFVERVVELDRKQPEFTRSFAQYYNARVTDGRVAKGREMLAEHAELLARVYLASGVPPRYLVAFWGLETNFGSYIGNMAVPSSLVTLACDARRSDFFTAELLDALKIVDAGDVSAEQLVGSWAGAMGQMQFMPSTFQRYSVDGDGDGRRDPWTSIPDALTSAGLFLNALGWVPELRWGREVQLPQGFDYTTAGLATRRPLADWLAAGVRSANGERLPALALQASVLVPAGAQGPAFLVYQNFDIIMRWNRSEFYAIAVGRLADRIAGAGKLARPALDDGLQMSHALISELQNSLLKLGFGVGEVDGVFGPGTRTALRQFQSQQGLLADGYPSAELLVMVNAAAQ